MILWCVMLSIMSCSKAPMIAADGAVADAAGFVTYTIKAGAHYASHDLYKSVATKNFSFLVRFDSSAIYKSVTAENQYDINKLYGFSDNDSAHHRYSARFGWRWSDGALRLFVYVYNAGLVSSIELGVVTIGATLQCSIGVAADHYDFYCNEYHRTLARHPAERSYDLLVHDDGSTDGALDDTAPGIVVLRNPVNQGIGSAMK